MRGEQAPERLDRDFCNGRPLAASLQAPGCPNLANCETIAEGTRRSRFHRTTSMFRDVPRESPHRGRL